MTSGLSLANQLGAYLKALNCAELESNKTFQAQIIQYVLLIEKWNRRHNLTAIRKVEDMLSYHIMDSLSVLPYIDGPHVIDVGSGAGLPGIPLALAKPEWQVVLLDSNHKKAAFLQQAVIELKLNNVRVVSQRVEQWGVTEMPGFNTVISRAFASLSDFVTLAGHLCEQGRDSSQLVAMKADSSAEERAQIPEHYDIESVVDVSVPGLEAKRQLIMIKRNNSLISSE